MLLLGVLLSVVMGVTLGLLGGGGSILAVPILIYVLGFEVKSAIATSLLVVATTSAASLLQHARAGNVHWRIGLVFGMVAMAGSYGGGRLAAWVPGTVLLTLFAAMMVATAVAMLRSVRRCDRSGDDSPAPGAVAALPYAKIAAEGLAVGAFTGLVGAGGGFLVVPALAILSGLPMRAAVGTSLLVIAMKSLSGFAAYVTHVSIDYELAAVVVIAAVGGALVGARLTSAVSPQRLRAAFAWFVLAMAVVILVQQAPAGGARQLGVAAIAAAAVGSWMLAHLRGARRRRAGHA